jgi:benzil reductase ((S)-benzoin forming)
MKKLALITGGGTGLGRAMAERFIALGVSVLVTGRREAPLLELQHLYPLHVFSVVADVSTKAGRADMIASIPADCSLSYLVHNAGTAAPLGRLLDIDEDAFRAQWLTNVEGPLMLTRLALPLMGSGARILHIGSGAAHHQMPGASAYGMTKKSLYEIYQYLKEELAGTGVFVGSLKPGVVATPMQVALREQAKSHVPELGRFVQLHEDNKLIPASISAQFCVWVLMNTTDVRFSEAEWDVYEASYMNEWCETPDDVVFPF